ncbi:MAG TPA: glycosyltransferase, partial [Leptospiraceae bacterium]|nr:glycosyltransferase [Leptospiraceae bacterium]
MKILAAAVTYNRKSLLERCILALKSQTYSDFEILVINNGSTDGTSDWLAENGIPYITQENSGGAGGFYRAVEEGLA